MKTLNNNLKNAQHNNQKDREVIFASNPVMKRLHKVEERAVDTDAASYGGITVKTVYFLLMTVVGIAIFHLLRATLFAGMEQIAVDISEDATYTFTLAELGICVVSLLLVIIMPIVARFSKDTVPVTGTIYSLAQGYLLAWIIMTCLTVHDADYIAWAALGITILLVAIMAILYSTRLIRVTKKFKSVMLVALITMVASSLLVFIAMFIPGVNEVIAPIVQNPALSIICAIIGIVIATLFLLIDFDTIEYTVTNQLPKKYEWSAALGLSFTVIWIYLKVLDLLITLNKNK